ncbi:MAG: hypothetical protein A3H70_00125 [Candidatus Komeilibacteria bacterium RIFCSPLOWO2_02_FULL_48_11]|uniref:Antitoxin n=1 Tax=Candidatus Komeilibacteria bacterium RIFCSPLOWO2_02_FULL_48_11 TaxID=1798553 RepID=A0A1G2BQN0_9BACT|nr:MAG: hypothetical protein A3H70_00125 [Candidatus Komeilibacteria bacterium RIFCSPLOWO2_02_FULL_48_11]
MKYYELDKEEEEILKAYEKGEFKSVKNLEKEKKRYQQIAQATLNKTRNINIRLSERDLQKIKVKAMERGLPYQTLVASVVHQYSNDRLKELA